MNHPNVPVTDESAAEAIPRLLIVDDTEDNLDLLEFALRKKRVDIFRASNGMECLAIAEKRIPDMILLDIQMPVMDGFETLRRLKENPVTKKIPVIFLTAAKKDAQSIERGIMMGAEDYLMKPIDTDELLARVRSITRLITVQRELEATKERFFAMLIHDLRSPLAGISDAVDFVVRSVEQGKPLEKIHMDLLNITLSSTQNLLEMVNDLLDLSKYQAGSIPLELKQIPVTMAVDQAALHMSSRFEKKGIRVVRDTVDGTPEALIDQQKMNQVLTNLLSNAFKFTPEGGTVTIRIAPVPPSTDAQAEIPMVEISVADSGIGIKAEELPNLFQYYHQVSSAKFVKYKGTGLGLVICKLIVEAHKGTINVTSEVGKGSTFTIHIPAVS